MLSITKFNSSIFFKCHQDSIKSDKGKNDILSYFHLIVASLNMWLFWMILKGVACIFNVLSITKLNSSIFFKYHWDSIKSDKGKNDILSSFLLIVTTDVIVVILFLWPIKVVLWNCRSSWLWLLNLNYFKKYLWIESVSFSNQFR